MTEATTSVGTDTLMRTAPSIQSFECISGSAEPFLPSKNLLFYSAGHVTIKRSLSLGCFKKALNVKLKIKNRFNR